ncbi:ERAD-associated protein, partial [Coemansia furcata]
AVVVVAASATAAAEKASGSLAGSITTGEANEGGQRIEIRRVVEAEGVQRAEFDKAFSVLQKYEGQLHSRLILQAERGSIVKLRRNVWKLVPSAVRPYVRRASGAVGGLLGLGSGDSGAAYQRVGVERVGREVRESVATLHRLAEAGMEDAVFAVAEMEMYGKYDTRVDVDAAFRHYMQLSEASGNATAQYMVGFLYATGLGA